MFLPLLILAGILIVQEIYHRKTSYYHVTKLPYLLVRFNLGRYGEYLTYKNLRHYEQGGARFLYNLYIPKGTEGTTEIDVLMISRKGLFVFESKNYSGWIFGSENQRNWYQTLPKGRGQSHKEAFYNPIMQNRTHIKHLQALLGEEIPMHSIITFSDRCTLKNVVLTSPDVHVINRRYVGSAVASICNRMGKSTLNEEQIREIYEKLWPYSQADAATKANHIAQIQRPEAPKPVPHPEEKPAAEGPRHPDPMICPRCGAALTLRTARKGANTGKQFYGCTNFPGCRYIRDV